MQWHNVRVRLGDVYPWERNPRRIAEKQADRLLASFSEYGQTHMLLIGPDNELYDGHQRLKVLLDRYGPDHEIEARQAERALDEHERTQLVGDLHKAAVGEWDMDMLLSEFEPATIVAMGFEDWELEIEPEPEPESNGAGPTSQYTGKIVSPHYEPAAEPPPVDLLCDTSTTERLLEAIDDAADLSEHERHFLKLAAQRHTIFNFKHIADYYAGASVTMQRLMEASALVIIDLDDAIKHGFVQLSKEILAIMQDDYPDD